MIRVLLADDHAVVRAGLERLLAGAPDLEVVGVAADGDEAVSLATSLEPDVVLMDLSMPGLSGEEATRAILVERPDTQIVVLTSFADRQRILDALDAGAVGYLLKDAEPADLLSGVRAAARRESPLSPRAARLLLSARRSPPPGSDLTDREREVLRLLAAGRANKLIARQLGISEKTVKAHLTRIFRAISVTDRTQAALWAQQHAGALAARGAVASSDEAGRDVRDGRADSLEPD